MLIFHIVCLCITLITLSSYSSTLTHAKMHRFMPMVLGIALINNFVQIIQCYTGEQEIFSCLEDVLILLMCYTLVHYCVSFCNVKLPRVFDVSLQLTLISGCILLCRYMDQPVAYQICYRIYVFIFISSFVAVAIYTYQAFPFSKKENHVVWSLYLTVLIPVLTLFIRTSSFFPSGASVTGGAACSCLIIWYLLESDRMVDTASQMRSELFHTGDMAMVLLDTDFFYLDANEAAEKAFPIGLEELRKKSGSSPFQAELAEMALKTGKPLELFIHDNYYRCKMEPYYRKNRLGGYIVSVIDITEEKLQTEEMQRLKEQAEAQTIIKSRFLARMSHDLRSPLHAIMGISDILSARGELSEQNLSLVEKLRRAGGNLLELVDSILLYSKMEVGRLELVEKPYDLEQLVEDLAYMTMINLGSNPVELKVRYRTVHPLTVLGDSLRVREILQNLLSNAVKYTERGKIECEISCERVTERSIRLICRVTDTGCGMSKKQLDHIFEEYVTYMEEKVSAGTGLGLPIVKQLAEMMEGTVRAESDGQSGSTFTVEFMQKLPEESEIWMAAHDYTKEEMMRHSARREKKIRPNHFYPGACVLLADDMKVNLEVFQELVAPWQLQLDMVSSGKEALEAVRKKDYQLIFLDQMMPEMNGTETAEQIRKLCDTPLVLLSADVSDENRSEGRKHGFVDFLDKPVKMVRLQEVIETYLPERYRSARKEMPRVIKSPEASHHVTQKVSDRVRVTYVEELRPLLEELPIYAETDLDRFRVKVHGIKGTSRQVGRMELGLAAERMETAAKTGDRDYITEHLSAFLEQVKENLQQTEAKLAISQSARTTRPMIATDPRVDGMGQEEERSISDLLTQLKEGFDAYDLSGIEALLSELECRNLSEQGVELLRKLKTAAADLEYEEGSELLSQVDESVF